MDRRLVEEVAIYEANKKFFDKLRENLENNSTEFAAAFMKRNGLTDPNQLTMFSQTDISTLPPTQKVWFEVNRNYVAPKMTLIEPEENTVLQSYVAIMKEMFRLNNKMVALKKKEEIKNSLSYGLALKRFQENIEFFKVYVLEQAPEDDGGFDRSKGPLTQKDIEEFGLNETWINTMTKTGVLTDEEILRILSYK